MGETVLNYWKRKCYSENSFTLNSTKHGKNHLSAYDEHLVRYIIEHEMLGGDVWYGILLPVQWSGQQWKKLDRSYPSIKHKQKWVWGDRPWKHFPSAGRKTCIWKVSVYSQLGDRHRNIVPVGLLLEQGTPWTGLFGAVKGGRHQYRKSTWSTQLICNIVNETDNPAGNLPDCTKMPMTQNSADLWHGSKSD